MTTEDDFQRGLDANPEDWQTRLVFADWLEERGDPRAEGYRALGQLRVFPWGQHSGRDWVYHDGNGNWQQGNRPIERAPLHHALPRDWLVVHPQSNHEMSSAEHLRPYCWLNAAKSRRALEDMTALAFAKLPADRRAELLSTEAVTA